MRHDRISKERPVIGRPARAARLLAPAFRGLLHEEVCVVHLDRHFGLMDVGVVRGGDAVRLPIGRLAREALALGASAVLIAHNHPGGDPTPSEADRIATVRLARALRPLSVLLVDHIVFGRDGWVSFRRLGWL